MLRSLVGSEMCIRDSINAEYGEAQRRAMKFVDRWIDPGNVVDVPDQWGVYALFALVAFIDLLNFAAFLGVKRCQIIVRKLGCFRTGYQHLFFSNVQSFKPEKVADPPENTTKWTPKKERTMQNVRRIIFVRHGESQWNKVFNRGIDKGKTLYRFILYPIFEMLKFFQLDSIFYDSPLSDMGIDQCQELSQFLSDPYTDPDASTDGKLTGKEVDESYLRGKADTRSIVVCSQLRRAAATAAIGLWPRLKASQEKILVLSSLMEQSRNFDCVPLSGPFEVPPLEDARRAIKDPAFDPATLFDSCGNVGDKPVRMGGKKGFERLMDFVDFCFQDELQHVTIIAVGHSLWFKKFFNCFLPHSTTDTAKTCKVHNCGAVGLTLERCVDHGKTFYRINPSEITEIHKGFKR
eukprot:TRINITY_DN43547_c0_g2_i1.p1 TRINITY_DN43547_c0_g2~~TRINITY_DN43547_c0_g2_i1.p1  ORF type:complete len:421 (+),score=115.05 TRINITY_DN43547_c0_g2_i1:48-1265(+)